MTAYNENDLRMKDAEPVDDIPRGRPVPFYGVSMIDKHTVIECSSSRVGEKFPDCSKYTVFVGTEEPRAIEFQSGLPSEVGVNGFTNEQLIAIICDRLRTWNAGPFSCRENSVAMTHLETALMWLNKRTIERQARGVEGTYEK